MAVTLTVVEFSSSGSKLFARWIAVGRERQIGRVSFLGYSNLARCRYTGFGAGQPYHSQTRVLPWTSGRRPHLRLARVNLARWKDAGPVAEPARKLHELCLWSVPSLMLEARDDVHSTWSKQSICAGRAAIANITIEKYVSEMGFRWVPPVI